MQFKSIDNFFCGGKISLKKDRFYQLIQSAYTCSRLTIETQEQGVKYV